MGKPDDLVHRGGAGWLEGAVSQDARWAASRFEPRNRDRFDLTSGVPVSSASERRADRLDHAIAGDRPSRSRSFDAKSSGLWGAGSTLPRSGTGELRLIVDSTGLKLRGAGEWLFEKHGTSKRRTWRKLHVGIDADNGQIVAFDLTGKEIDDASHVEPLLEQLDDAPASFMGDGAYDRAHVLNAVLVRNPDVRFIVPPCKGAVLGPTATTVPTQRDSHLRSINKHGRMNWQKTSGYNRRSKVKAAIGRYKRVIGDALRSREDARRLCEVHIAVKVLNRMLKLGRPFCVRVA